MPMFLKARSWTLWRKFIVIWVFLVVLDLWMLPICIGVVVTLRVLRIIVSGVMGILLLPNFIRLHSRRIHYISNAFHGATNDITITYNDNYPRKLMLCQVHQDRVFRTFTRTSEVIYWRGAYVIITDGGYPTCFSFVNPTLPNYEYHTVICWADVERLFGTLKFCFRWFLGPILYHDLETVSYAVRVSAILHNRLLVYDGIDWDKIDDSMDRDQDNISPDILAQLVPLPDLPPVHDPDLPVPTQLAR